MLYGGATRVEVRAVSGGIDVGMRGARPNAVIDIHVERAEPFLLEAVDIIGAQIAGLFTGLDERPVEGVGDRQTLRRNRPRTAAPGVFTPAVGLTAFEIGQDVGIRPAPRTLLCPTLVVTRVTAEVGHAVD